MELPQVPPACPKCGDASKVAYTVETLRGSDCRCRACGNVWHMDVQPLRTPDPGDQHPRAKNGNAEAGRQR
jgi:uncharacterized Zn finger protein